MAQSSAAVLKTDTERKLEEPQVEEKSEETRQIWFCELFRFATKVDVILMVIGSIAAMAMGVALPAFAFIWGQMTDAFTDSDRMV